MSPQRFSRSFIASETGSSIVNAISLFPGAHAKLLTPSSVFVRRSASPPRDGNAIDLALAVAVRHECEPRAIG